MSDRSGEAIEETVDVLTGRMDVRSDAQRVTPDACNDPSIGEGCAEPLGSTPWDLDPEHVRSVLGRGRYRQTESRRPSGDLIGDGSQASGNSGDTPPEYLLRGGNPHRYETKAGPLADVEAPCTVAVLVDVVDEGAEVLRPCPVDPILLDRLAVPVVLGDVQATKPERSEQPLVADSNHEVGLQRGDVQGERSEGLTGVEGQRRVNRTGRLGDRVEVEQRTVGPVHGWGLRRLGCAVRSVR